METPSQDLNAIDAKAYGAIEGRRFADAVTELVETYLDGLADADPVIRCLAVVPVIEQMDHLKARLADYRSSVVVEMMQGDGIHPVPAATVARRLGVNVNVVRKLLDRLAPPGAGYRWWMQAPEDKSAVAG